MFKFNNVDFETYKTFWDGSQLFDTPEKDVTFFEVPGRNGSLSISNGRYKNLTITVKCFIRDDFKTNFAQLMNFLLSQEGYCKLETSEEPDTFRMAQYVKALTPKTTPFIKSGAFSLVFECKPQKYLNTGDILRAVGSEFTAVNPTLMEAYPYIEVEGTGALSFGGTELTLSQNTGTTVIDSEMQDAYEGPINRNPYLTMTNGFPVLTAGNNTGTFTGFSAVRIKPRWWML